MLNDLLNQDNWLSVLLAAVAYWVVGAIWYGVLGKTWMNAANLTKEKIDSGSKIIYLYTFILEFIIVLAMGTLMDASGIIHVSDAVQFGAIVGLILSGFTTWVHYMYTGQKRDLYWIDAGYTTIASIVACVILTVM
ncbi:MAG: DUF1761 domain-containing protein [Chitinophagales bacterium]